MSDFIEYDAGEVPAIASYQEWIGTDAPSVIPAHTRTNVATSMMAQNADVTDLVTSFHYHKGLGWFLFASAPVLPSQQSEAAA